MHDNKNEENFAEFANDVADVSVNAIGVRSRGQRRRALLLNTAPSLTKQADHDRACIHRVLENAARTGILPLKNVEPVYNGNEAIPNVDSYHDAMNVIVSAQQQFDALPSEIRERFNNSPATMLEQLSDPKNRQEMVSLGLMNPVGEGANAPSQSNNVPDPNGPKAMVGEGTAPSGAQ